MIKIQAMGIKELKQVFSLLEQFTEESFKSEVLEQFQHLYGPIQQISQALPPRLQFTPAIYVALSKEKSQTKVLGLIWLSKDGKKNNRWKIEQLIIDPQEFSFDVGAQLINYVINRYGAEGVQTFLAVVHHQYEQALSLLKSCGFRHVTRLHYFCHENPTSLASQKPDIRGLREVTASDRFRLKELHLASLPTDKRLSFEKSHRDFNPSFFENMVNGINGVFSKRWVVEDRIHETLLGSLLMSTTNLKDFHLELTLSPAWEDGYEDLLNFGIYHALQQTSTPRLFVEAFAFNDYQLKHLEQLQFSRLHDAEILVKDYWIPLKDQEKRTSPVLLFDGKPSTA